MKNSVLVSILAIAYTCVAQFDPEQCGPKAGNQKCKQSKCCSQYGWCGNSNAYCMATQGCQPGFGRCVVLSRSTSTPSSSAARSSTVATNPSATGVLVSKNARCGSAFSRQTCQGSIFGSCCSRYNWCGTTNAHCQVSMGCQLGFGTCTGVQSSSISLSLSRSSTQRSSSSSVLSTHSESTYSATSGPSSSSTRSLSLTSSHALSSSAISTASITLSTYTSLSSSGSDSTTSSESSQSSSSSFLVTTSSTAQSSSTTAFPSVGSSSSVASSSSIIASTSSSSFISSTNTLTASPSASSSATVITHVLRAARNPAVDRTAPENLLPKNALSFFFTEDGTFYTTSIQTNLDSGALGVLLENIASVSSVTCSGSTIDIQFSDETSFNTASNWPVGTIIFTLSDGCNSATERGVYRLGSTRLTKLRARVASPQQNTNVWQLSLEVLLIQMEAAVADYESKKQAAAQAAADITSSVDITPTSSIVLVSSSTAAQTSASATGLPACGGYAPGGRFDIAGSTYQISCTLAGTWRSIWMDITYQESFTACIAHCSTSAQCMVATYNEAQIMNGKYMCQRWSLLPYKTDNALNAPMAVKVVPGSS